MTDETAVSAETKPRTHTRRSGAKKASRKPSKVARKGRSSQFDGKKIVKLVRENPRRNGTIGHKSFSLITSGMRYEQYRKKGGRPQDLAFDIARKYVRLAK